MGQREKAEAIALHRFCDEPFLQAEMIQQMAVANRAVEVRKLRVKPGGALHHGHPIAGKKDQHEGLLADRNA